MDNVEQLLRDAQHASSTPGLRPGLARVVLRHTRRRRRLQAVSAGGAVAAIVVTAAVTLDIGRSSSTNTQPSNGGPHVMASHVAAGPASAPPQPSSASPEPSSAPAKTSGPDDAAALRAAPYYYERTINEQNGVRSVRQAWIGHHTDGRAVQPEPGSTTTTVVPLSKNTFNTAANATLTWNDFSTTPTVATLHDWMYEMPATSISHYGSDLNGTPRGNEYAFTSAEDLLRETPTTAAFRLAVLAAAKQVPGVVIHNAATDEVGRTGIMLSLPAAPNVGVEGSTTEYIIDPATGRLLQSTIVDPTACPSGSVMWRAVYLQAGPVPNDTVTIPETTNAPTAPPANCALPGQAVPPGSSVTTKPAP